MSKIRLLKLSLAGLGLQVLLHAVAIIAPLTYRHGFLSIYDPWIAVGTKVFGSNGAGGHAMAGDAILGWLIGVVVYSILVGVVLYFTTNIASNEK